MGFKKLSDFLWPIGATVLGLFAVPLAIEQYPDFFKENRWPLPISVLIVIICWLLPLFLHERAKNIWTRIPSTWAWKGGSVAVAVICIALISMGAIKLFHYHTKHLASVLAKREPPKVEPQTGDQRKVEVLPSTASSVDVKVKTTKSSSLDFAKFIHGLSDQRLSIQVTGMTENLNRIWEQYWNFEDQKLWIRQMRTTDEREKKKIQKDRDALGERALTENQQLLSDAVSLADECSKRPRLSEEGEKLRAIISRFYDWAANGEKWRSH